MPNLLDEILFIFQRLNWLSFLDLTLVTLVIFSLLYLLRDTKVMVLLRGVLLVVILLSLFTSLVDLPAFSWLVRNTMPALLFAIPVIFAPEIRRGLEQLGRAGGLLTPSQRNTPDAMIQVIKAVVSASARLATRQHGALIVMQRSESLKEYIQTGVQLNSRVSTELLLQIFYPNTPLHDGAVIIADNQIKAAACVMPLSASGILLRTPERQMGLRHRAALGTSEASDAITVVVSEETGSIAIAHSGRMIRRLDPERLENILLAFYRPSRLSSPANVLERIFPFLNESSDEEQ